MKKSNQCLKKYACPKLKMSKNCEIWTVIGQLCKSDQKEDIPFQLNSKKHTPSPAFWFLRNCGIAQNSSCGIAQNLSFAKAE